MIKKTFTTFIAYSIFVCLTGMLFGMLTTSFNKYYTAVALSFYLTFIMFITWSYGEHGRIPFLRCESEK